MTVQISNQPRIYKEEQKGNVVARRGCSSPTKQSPVNEETASDKEQERPRSDIVETL